MSEKSIFTLEFKVRDYECDMQGIVNNANYQHYMEHARHEFLHEVGLDFAELTREGIILVVKRIEIDYLSSLRSGDLFTVSCEPVRISPLRFGFKQNIIRLSDQKPIINAFVTGTSINSKGRPFLPSQIEEIFRTH